MELHWSRRLPGWDEGFCALRYAWHQASRVKGHVFTRRSSYRDEEIDAEEKLLDFKCENCPIIFTFGWPDQDPVPEDGYIHDDQGYRYIDDDCPGYINMRNNKDAISSARREYGYKTDLAQDKKTALAEFRAERILFGHRHEMREQVDRQKQILEDVRNFFPPGASKSVVAKATRAGWLFTDTDRARLERVEAEAEAAARAAREAGSPEQEHDDEPLEQEHVLGEAAEEGAASGEDGEDGEDGLGRERDGDAASPEPPKKRIKLVLPDPSPPRPHSAQHASPAPASTAPTAGTTSSAPRATSATSNEPDKAPSPSPFAAAQTSSRSSADDDLAARSTTPIEVEPHEQPRQVDKGKGRAVLEEDEDEDEEDEDEEDELQASSPEPGHVTTSRASEQPDLDLAAVPAVASAAERSASISRPLALSQLERSSTSAGAERRQESPSPVAAVVEEVEVVDLLNEEDDDEDVKPALDPAQLLLSDPSSLGHLLFSLPSPFAFAKHLALFHHPSIDLTLAAELLDIASSPDDLDDLLAELVKDRVGQDGETLRGMAPTWAKALRRALRKRLEEGAGK
ncbi:hypothetical protein JCM8208_003183 [Rhodotorula glutinis]